ncbi:hypothetical protein DL768_004885 [Monosporascus sp. mg162]|nr:hypothetical protein DL768_004885 [Monosporascus sp. mg162]
MASEHYEHAYPLENSEESSRLRNQHDVIKDAMGGLVLAPINLSASPLRILDSGTADGTWIRDLTAATAPVSHEFFGTDINPAEFPADSPANIAYQAQDINQPWPTEWEGQFDFVHQRLVLVGAGPKQKEALQSLGGLVKPGGWIQVIEATNKLPEGCGPVMHAFVELMNAVFETMGADLNLADRLPEWLEGAGFVDIQDRLISMKLGARNSDATLASRGVFSTSTAARGLAQFGKTLPPGKISLSSEKLDTLGSDLEEELKKVGGVYPLRVVWGRKATRIFPRRIYPTTTYAIWCGLALNIVTYVALIIQFGVSCTPRSSDNGQFPATCMPRVRQIQGIASATVNAALDLYVLVLAVPSLWKLQIATRKKIGVVAVLGVGVVALEPILAIITACLPTLPALWVEISTKVGSSIRGLLSRISTTSEFSLPRSRREYRKGSYELHNRSMEGLHPTPRGFE